MDTTTAPQDHSLTSNDPDVPDDDQLADPDVTMLHQWTKVHGQAKLARLTPEQHECLRDWLEDENYPYYKVVELIRQQFGIVVGKSTVSLYYRRHILAAHHDAEADAATKILERPITNITAATLNHARVLAWTLLTRPTPQIDLAARLLEVIRRADQQEISRERLALEKERVALRRQELAARPPRQPRHSPKRDGGRTLNLAETSVASGRPPCTAAPAITAELPETAPNPPLFPTSSTNESPSPNAALMLPTLSAQPLPSLAVASGEGGSSVPNPPLDASPVPAQATRPLVHPAQLSGAGSLVPTSLPHPD